MFRYVPIKESLYSDDLGSYISFGIKVFDDSNCAVVSVSDISVNETFVSELCNLCTLHQLNPIHLLDIIEDNI